MQISLFGYVLKIIVCKKDSYKLVEPTPVGWSEPHQTHRDDPGLKLSVLPIQSMPDDDSIGSEDGSVIYLTTENEDEVLERLHG